MDINYEIMDSNDKLLLNMMNYNLNSSYKGNMHSHHYLEISYIKEGNGTYIIDDKTYDINKGDIFIFSNTENHLLIVDPNSNIINQVIHFEPRFIWSQTDDSFDSRYLSVFFKRNREFKNRWNSDMPTTLKMGDLFLEIEAEFQDHKHGYELMIKVKLLNILVLMCRHYDYLWKDSSNMHDMKQGVNCINNILDYIDFNLDSQISLKDLAGIAHMNISYFSTFFKKYNGIGPSAYIASKRIEKAIDYLKFSDKSITEISSICGFNNTTSFYNAFKKFDGMYPSIYRKK
jgi:AraC-like DNA-binding protein